MNRISLLQRPRRNRQSAAIRDMVRETVLTAQDFILPLFIIDGENKSEAIASMPGISRLSPDLIVSACKDAHAAGIPAVALFPCLGDSKKDPLATEGSNPDGLFQDTIKRIKDAVPEIAIVSDVAMDPYSSDGHDGLVRDGEILNDPTLEILAAIAISQAEAGADIIAPSDMMDGRIAYIRDVLDESGFEKVAILAYSAKYASSFYGPFRDALDSAPKEGDKKTYQMDPANLREAIREVELDIAEGADMVMIKPALPYLDVVKTISDFSTVPVAAYNVSGEYAMIKAAGQLGWLDAEQAAMESVLSIKRAGADIILTYFAMELADKL
ncbi:MAG: porphobilinogen synthase [Lentisphaeria bacterium]|nr:porphobilinogen synthase [Lentisphaeria bacterium]NQZ68555.1 porphobilinogen synthase [Lentisphaeria bacterium]